MCGWGEVGGVSLCFCGIVFWLNINIGGVCGWGDNFCNGVVGVVVYCCIFLLSLVKLGGDGSLYGLW